MDAFGYVSVIISVVIGLGLSYLLTGTGSRRWVIGRWTTRRTWSR